MSLPRRSRQRITLLTLHALALSLSVVLWGTCYKLEQYPQQGLAFRVMPPAKLLTEKERPVRKQGVQAALVPASQERGSGLSAAWAAPASSRRVHSASGEEQLAAIRCVAGSAAEFTYFFFRPPPAHSFS